MRASYKLKKLQRARKLRRQRSAFFLVLTILFVMMAHSAFSKQEVKGDEYEVMSVTVQPGDTLWTIASEYKPEGTDLREFVYDIAANNGIKDCQVFSGQTLFIPVG